MWVPWSGSGPLGRSWGKAHGRHVTDALREAVPRPRRDTASMASANLDLVRSIYADWERGDFGRTAGLHPDIAWACVGGPEPGQRDRDGRDGRAMRNWLHAWNEWPIEATDYRELDGERILMFCRGVGGRQDERIGPRAAIDRRGEPLRGPRQQGHKARHLLAPRPAFADLGLTPDTGT